MPPVACRPPLLLLLPHCAGTTILSVNTMPTCGLGSGAGNYEIKAWSKCSSWRSGTTPKLQLALMVTGVSQAYPALLRP